ncbi:F0F1 ATP synthase subunit B [Buchnera aphidicola]|uniref:ATP synthase subunit b n=1 Tax=Buchnera aphidicola (Sarucallis kahawaluokalani) TaxID=1241878 RepID=A0A4D6Y7E7_9GAMM|nr:F0F1 ATP synthase subunit B [Buchnera aphidicola]QCI25816.1 ATP synthase F0 subunit B [Buchnera aphidicola (Sarucallis kahawaluokalani)]
MDLNATILGQMISFIIFIWFCMKYIWPKLIITINDRRDLIQKEFANISQSKKDIQKMYNQANEIIYTAKHKSKEIIKSANLEKIVILERAKYYAEKEKKKILQQAEVTIQMKKIQLKKKLTKEISTLASMMANKIIINTIDTKYKKHNFENMINTF